MSLVDIRNNVLAQQAAAQAAQAQQNQTASNAQVTPNTATTPNKKVNTRLSIGNSSRKDRAITEEEQAASAYMTAKSQGQSVDSWYSDSQAAYTGAKDNYDRLQAKYDELNARKNSQDNGSMFGSVMAKARGEDVSDETLGKYETALKQAQAQLEKTEAELKSASRYKTDQDNKNKMNERLVQNGYDYGRVYDEAKATSQQLKRQKEAVDALIRSAKTNLFLNPETGEYEQYKGDIGQYRKELDSRSEILARLLKEAEDFEDYSFRYIGKGLGAKNAIEKGLEEEGRLLAEQTKAGERVLGESDSEGGISLYTKYRGATRQGTHVTEDWPQEAVDRYRLILGRYGQQAAEEYAGQVNLALNQAKQTAGGGNWWNMGTTQAEALGAQANGTKGQKFAAGAGTLAATIGTPLFHAMSYIDKLSAVAAGVPYTGRDFALPSDLVQAAAKGRAGQLNKDYGTLGKNAGFLAGKGWGDAFQLSQSMVQSLAMGHTIGEVGTLAAFFAQAADTAFDEAKARGGSDQYAAGVSLLTGLAEVAGEKISLENLLKGDTKNVLKFLAKHGFIEGSEEVGTSALNMFFDRVVADLTGDRTEIESQIDQLVRDGMSRQDAEKRVWTEKAKEVAFDFVGGFVSGMGSGGAETAIRGTRNQLWEMRKDSVLGKTNAEGQREGGKANVSEDALRGLIDRALKRGDLRGAEELAQALQQKTGTAEEQEYGPADPRANEKMQGRLARQLNGENVNQRETAEAQDEAQTNAPPALPEEFKDLNPVVAQQFARYEGRDLEMITRSIMPQAAYRYEQYLRAIGQTKKADLVERFRTDPNYHYEEQPPAYTDAEDQMRQRQQEAAGQQEAPGGQITQPQTQETAGVVKPQDSAQPNNTLYNITQNPYGVSTKGTESGTIAAQTNQEVNNNAGEQTVRADEAAKRGADASVVPSRSETGNRLETNRSVPGRDSGRLNGESLGGEGQVRKLGKPYRAADGSSVTDLRGDETLESIGGGKPNGKSSSTKVLPGTRHINEPSQTHPAYRAWQLAKRLGIADKVVILENESGLCIPIDDGLVTFGEKLNTDGRIYLFINNDADSLMEYSKSDKSKFIAATLLHEYIHEKLAAVFPERPSAKKTFNRANDIAFLANEIIKNAKLEGLDYEALAEYILDDAGYRKSLENDQETKKVLRWIKATYGADYKKNAKAYVQALAIEEILADNAGKGILYGGVFSKLGYTEEQANRFHDAAIETLKQFSFLNDAEAKAINSYHAGEFDTDEAAAENAGMAETGNGTRRRSAAPSGNTSSYFKDGRWYLAQNIGLNKTLKTILNGDTNSVRALSDEDLFGAMKYILDKGLSSGQNGRISEGQAISNLFLGVDSRKANNPTAWTYEKGYQGGTFRGMNQQQKNDMFTAAERIITELAERDYSISSLSDFSKYANRFGIITDKKGNEIDISIQPKSEENTRKNADAVSMQEEDAKEAAYDRRHMARDLDALRKAGERQKSGKSWKEAGRGANYVEEAVPTKPEDHGWIKPVEVSEKDVKRARDAVEAKGKEAQLKDRIKTLEAQKYYLTAVADAMQHARSDFYASGDIEQRKADLGYLADNAKEQLAYVREDLAKITAYVENADVSDAEMANLATALTMAEDQSVVLTQQIESRLEGLRDEYAHLQEGDSQALREVRNQITQITDQIFALSRQLDNVSKRAERADWGSNKRTLFQAEMAENPNGLVQERNLPEQNREEPLFTTGWPQSAVDRASGKTFRSEFDTEPTRRDFEDPIAHMSTQELDNYLKQMRQQEDTGRARKSGVKATDAEDPAHGMGTGYRGMQTSRSKDGSLEFRTMYDDALPTRPATDKSRQAINAPSTAYGNVAQAARSILNSKSSFFDFSKNRPKDIPSKVTNTMGQLHEHVREMMEGEHPVNALMQISNMIREFENDDDLKVFTSDSIQKAVAELNDIYYNQDITNEEKAKRMVENATKTLSLISKRVQLVDRGYHMLKSFVGPRKKRDDTDFWSKYKAMQLNPSTLFKAMDGFAKDKNGSGYQIAKMIENGTALYTITQAQALQKLSAISSMEGFKEFSEGNTKPFDIDGVKITEQQAVEFIMQVRNLLATEVTGKDGPTNRLNTIEGFSIRDKDGKSTFIERSNDADGTNAEWFANLAEDFENSLSPAAKKYLEAATEILDELGQQASDIRTNLIGTGFDGSINGTYYPITYDNKNGKSNSQQSQPTGLASGPMYQSRTRNVGGYVNIKNASDTLDKYIHWASNFIGYGEVAELLRAMGNTGGRMQSLSGLANDMLGQGYSKYIEKYVNDVNEVQDGQKDNDSIWAKLRRNMAAGALLGNLGVAAKQAASLWSAAGVLSPQAILSAETWFGKYSGAGNMLLQSRKIGTSLDPTISEILHNDSFMGKLMKRTRVSEFMGKATAFVDYQTVKRLFAATVVDTKLSFPGLDQNSELFAQAVKAKFQDVVLQTQPIFVKNARAGYLRANDELTKAFAMFRTQPTQNLNAIVTAIGEYNALKGTEYGKAAGKKLRNTIIGQTVSAVTFAILSSLVGFARHGWKKFRDDDDELSWLEAAKRIGLDSVESLAGLTVVGGDIAKAIITMATGGEEKEFYDMNTGVLSMLGDTLSSVTTFGTNVVKAIQEGKPLAVFNAGRQAADNLLQVGLGIPANTVYRMLNTITMYSAEALYALSDGKLGNRANYDDAMKMLDSYIKGNLTEEGAKTQAAKAFRKGQTENLLYNLGILSSLSTSDTDKGRVWLQNHLPKDEDKSVNRRILDYLISNAVSNEQMDEAVEKYVTADGFNAMYAAVRDTGVSPQSAIATIDAADGNKNGEFTQNELWEYYKANQSKDKQVGAMFDAKGYTKDGQPRTWDSYKAEQERKEFKTVVDTNSNGKLTQAELLEYYRAHPDEEDKIKELWESNGWKTTWSSYKAKNAS